MSLERYRQKRRFHETPEPEGKVRAARPGVIQNSFVIQKHDASRLHYDFRLEADGVLKSWAVPKGPSLDPAQKRLAVEVEDHPLDYGNFEGTIPSGQYGAGTVLVWDRGTWTLEKGRTFAAAHRAGKIEFELAGEKLAGRWVLVRTHGQENRRQPNWLLIKRNDEFARPGDGEIVDELAQSVKSGRRLEEVAAGKPARKSKARRAKSQPKSKSEPRNIRAPLPTSVRPQLATLAQTPPAGDAWLHEIKLDGYRMLAFCEPPRVRLMSRNDLEWTDRFRGLAATLGQLPVERALLDGEVVMLDAQGVSQFQLLQEALSRGRTEGAIYFVFDLLACDGEDLRKQPLEVRKERLAKLLAAYPGKESRIRLSEHILSDGDVFFQEASRMGLEGIVSKRRQGLHHPGRSSDWLKIKSIQQEPFVIAGYTRPSGSRQVLGALLLGRFDSEGDLVYAGKVGTGFGEKALADLQRKLSPVRESPFASKLASALRRDVTWVKPALVCQVGFAGWTRDRLLRQARFLGLRSDRRPSDLKHDESENLTQPEATMIPPETRLTHSERVLFPEAKVTKQDLAEYYAQVADWILPHLGGRPLSIVRCPRGLAGQRFFQKHAGAGIPAQVHRVMIPSSDESEPFLAVDDLAGLLALVQISALELHVWGSRVDRPEKPDRLVFDLDPDASVPWTKVIEAAFEVRKRLAALDLESFVKTTGGKGLHVVVPISRTIDWATAKEFTRGIARAMVEEEPARYVMKVAKAARAGKILIDYLRNGEGATAVAAYSSRAKGNASVSAPLTWEELPKLLASDQYTVRNLPKRLDGLKRDPWGQLARVKQSITRAMLRQATAV